MKRSDSALIQRGARLSGEDRRIDILPYKPSEVLPEGLLGWVACDTETTNTQAVCYTRTVSDNGQFQPGHHSRTEWQPCQKEGHSQERFLDPKTKRYRGRCRECNLDKQRRAAKRRHERRRQQALDAYGGKCTCCGETQAVFLAIDHEDGGGNEHRRLIKASGSTTVYRWLEANNYPEGFRVLCHNCNYAEHHGGCPHQSST